MTDEEIRVAIAESCGYDYNTASDCWMKNGKFFFIEDPHSLPQLPDYVNDLNAMHEAEKFMDECQFKKYCGILIADVIGWKAYQKEYLVAHASARQRAEAYLKTLKLWKP